MTLSGTCGVLNDALSIYFGDPALASRASPDGALETRLRRPAPEGGGHYFGLINGLPPGVKLPRVQLEFAICWAFMADLVYGAPRGGNEHHPYVDRPRRLHRLAALGPAHGPERHSSGLIRSFGAGMF